MKRIVILAAAVFFCAASSTRADTFGSGANSFEIEFVRIGDPGNPPDDLRPIGAVFYEYRMGKYEISEQMIDKSNAMSAEWGEPLDITKDTRGPNKPATSVSWFEAAKFVNWLNTSTGHTPAYKTNAGVPFQPWLPTDAGYDASNIIRNKLAKYFLPSIDEWYKAAYYDPAAGHYWDYPTGSNATPDGIDFIGDPDFDAVFNDGTDQLGPIDVFNAGELSPYGTAAQGGNAYEWNELPSSGGSLTFPQRGGSWESNSFHLNTIWNQFGIVSQGHEDYSIGFRIASEIPETGALVLLILGIGTFWISPLTLKRDPRGDNDVGPVAGGHR